jgi:nucleoredoxin
MKRFISTAILALAASSLLQARTWTSTAGTTVEGELVDFANRTAVIQTADDRRLAVPLQLLSSPDQEYVKEWFVAKKEGKGGGGKLSAGLDELLPKKLLDSKGKKVSRDELAGKTIGFYFSAHWCPPCRTFTPNLVKFRDANKENFEVVFVSSDKSPDAQMGYMKETNMKWVTVEHRSAEANALSKKFGIRGIPALIIVSPEGETITKNGRGEVSSNPKGAWDSWQKP